MNKATSPTGRFGVIDTEDNSWMGNEDGPLRYDDHELACAAATIINEQFGHLARFRCREIPDGMFRHKDELHSQITASEAIERIEKRGRNER